MRSEPPQAGRTRARARAPTDVSRPTLGRILDCVQARGWVTTAEPGNGHPDRLTPLGRVLAQASGDVTDTVETVQSRRELAPQLPLDELELDSGVWPRPG